MKLSNNLIKALLEEEKMFEEEAYLFNNIRKVLDEDESYLIESQYERAIARSSTYKCWPLSNHVASDFAPSTLREGMELIRYLADFHQAIVMAVPLKLVRQTWPGKPGVGGGQPLATTTQWFAGQYVTKYVLGNQKAAVKAVDIERACMQCRQALRHKPQLP